MQCCRQAAGRKLLSGLKGLCAELSVLHILSWALVSLT
jgi:hypothetical protein